MKIAFIASFLLLFMVGCGSIIPSPIPVYAPGTLPTAAQIAQERQATATVESDANTAVVIVEAAVIAGALPASDAQAAVTLNGQLDVDCQNFDAAYASGNEAAGAGASFLAIEQQVIIEIAAINNTPPAKIAALKHAKRLKAATQPKG
jgi:hypothetical protein